jgi:hypothetical protein
MLNAIELIALDRAQEFESRGLQSAKFHWLRTLHILDEPLNRKRVNCQI